MSKYRRFLAVVIAAGFGSAALAGVPAPTGAALADVQPTCSSPAQGDATCAALISTSSTTATSSATPAGYSPTDLRDAYGFQPGTAGMRQTVAVVTAYDDPAAESDLATYRSQYRIAACTTADSCFQKTDQNGSTNYPSQQQGWAAATAQSVDMISAVCPNCDILLVEANSAAITDLGTAENTAVNLGAKFITNTWYTTEATFGAAETSYDTAYFDHPGVAITAPAGNNGYGVTYPAASQHVTAVGGTTLTSSTSGYRGWAETAWSGTGSGCSAYEPKPAWQADTGCADRTSNDVAAVADPVNSAVAFYDTGSGGWASGGGTTISAAIIAAAYALAGTPAASTDPTSYPYATTKLLNDITAGTNGTCSITYLCTAGSGYDGPSGRGTPASTVPFTASGSLTGAIPSGENGFCLDDKSASTATDNPVQIYTCNGTSAQKWTVNADATISALGSYCMTVQGGGTSDGTPVVLASCNGWARQQWRPVARWGLVNPSSGKCLDDPGGSTTNGTQLDIATCDGWARQQWFLPYRVPISTGNIHSGADTSKCAEDKDGSTTDGTLVWLEPCTNWARQSWTIAANGTLQVNGVCLAPSGLSVGDTLEVHSCNGRYDQQWVAQSDGSLLNLDASLCVGLQDGSTADGTPLFLWNCNGNSTQRWILPS